jgi:hypothetical protein
MLDSAIIDLRRASDWNPAQLTAEAFRWPSVEVEAPLRDVASRIVAQSFANAGAPVVTPAGLDAHRGGVRKRSTNYQGPAYQVGRELRTGDILVPPAGGSTALYVSEFLQGALVSSRFTALRPVEPDIAIWLWALLSSESGQRWRNSLVHGSASPLLIQSGLLDSLIPLPSMPRLQALTPRLRAEEQTTHLDEEVPAQTWWRLSDLREIEWRFALATPEPESLNVGMPFGRFCEEVRAGGNTRRDSVEAEAPGYLPVADVSMLGGKPVRRWVPAEGQGHIIAQHGDLLVAAIGNPAYATVADAPVVVDAHVYRVRLREPEQGHAFADYLNSADGYRFRQLLLTGSTVPHLNRSDLERLPVRDGALQQAAPEPVALLSRRLERILWPH